MNINIHERDASYTLPKGYSRSVCDKWSGEFNKNEKLSGLLRLFWRDPGHIAPTVSEGIHSSYRLKHIQVYRVYQGYIIRLNIT